VTSSDAVAAEPEFLSRLTDEERAALMAAGRRHRSAPGSYLLIEGTQSGVVYVVLAGHVKVFCSTDDGAEVVLAVMGADALLGEFAAIDERPRSASVAALGPVEVLAVPVAAFTRFLWAYPRVPLLLMRMLIGRLREADRRQVEFGSHDVAGRVALRLVELAERFGEPGDGGVRINVAFTQDELAGWVGASREAVVKALRILRSRGYVETQRKTMLIRDLPGLRLRAGID